MANRRKRRRGCSFIMIMYRADDAAWEERGERSEKRGAAA